MKALMTGLLLSFGVAVVGIHAKTSGGQKVFIRVQKVDQNVITFVPLLPATFEAVALKEIPVKGTLLVCTPVDVPLSTNPPAHNIELRCENGTVLRILGTGF